MKNIKEIAKDIAIRTIKTMAEVAGSMITVGLTLSEIDFKNVLSVTAVAGIYCILLNISKIEEV